MSFIEISKPRPHVTLVTLNRPERMNAMAFDVMIPLRDTLREISEDNDCRVVVLTGAGHGFCSGADLVGGGMVPNISGLKRTSIARRALRVLDDVILAIRDMHQPVIAAVNGAAIGGGFCLACAADIRIGSDAAYFRAAGINNGLTANELGISYLLPRQIGFSRAFDILLTGRDVDAAEAERIGLVTSVVPGSELLNRAREIAGQIMAKGPLAVRLAKLVIRSGMDADQRTGLVVERLAQALLYTTDDKNEGTDAFLGKRRPVFQGR